MAKQKSLSRKPPADKFELALKKNYLISCPTSDLSCVNHKNRFFVSDSDHYCIKVFDQAGQFLYKFGSKGTENGQFVRPSGLHIDRHGCLLVCDQGSGRFQKFSLEGRFIGKCTTPGLENLNGVVEMPDGRILVTSTNYKKVYIMITK